MKFSLRLRRAALSPLVSARCTSPAPMELKTPYRPQRSTQGSSPVRGRIASRRVIVLIAMAGALAGNASCEETSPLAGNVVEDNGRFSWHSALLQSFFAFTIAHAERFPRERGTRDSIEGPFWRNYLHDVQNLHGWQDGDGLLTSYIAHPMEGAMAGFIERQNDPAYRTVEFGRSSRYWSSVVRSLAFSTLYNVAWSLSPYGEAGLGNVDIHAPPGLVDPVGSELLGTGWLIGEDTVDRYLIRKIEDKYQNRVVRAFARGGLNPIRSYSNMLRLKAPWYRDGRSLSVLKRSSSTRESDLETPAFKATAWPATAIELTPLAYVQRNTGPRGSTCTGGGGEASVSVSRPVAIVFDVDGCTLLGIHAPDSGDMLNYLVGPRWFLTSSKHWIPDVQLLIGGAKVTHSHMDLAKKTALLQLAAQTRGNDPPLDAYVTEVDTNGFSVRAGGGLAYQINELLVLRIASVSYQRSLVSTLQNSNYNQGLRFSFGLGVRLGPWRGSL